MSEERYSLKQVQVRLRLAEAEPLYSTEPLHSPEQAARVMAKALAEMDREYVCIVNLDTKMHPINFNIVSIGGLDSSLVPVQNVFKAAILSNAASIMMFHNHPSGSLEPSHQDELLTRKLIEAGKLMDIPVTDHIIIGGGNGKQYSFRTERAELFSVNEPEQIYEGISPVREGPVQKRHRH